MSFTWRERDGVALRVSGLLERSGAADHGFSARTGGASAGVWASLNLGYGRGDGDGNVTENWRRLCAAAGTARRVFRVRQVHGDRIRAVTEADLDRLPERRVEPAWLEADGLVTDVPGISVAVMTADCLPVLLCDPRRRCVAAVHSGWRGTALAVCARAVERMTGEYGCRPEDILAAVGPAIGPCCFETDDDVPRAMRGAFGPRMDDCIRDLGGGRYRVDLKGIAARTLTDAGLLPGHVDLCPDCTACLPDRYWSHRRMGAARGSMAAVISLRS